MPPMLDPTSLDLDMEATARAAPSAPTFEKPRGRLVLVLDETGALSARPLSTPLSDTGNELHSLHAAGDQRSRRAVGRFWRSTSTSRGSKEGDTDIAETSRVESELGRGQGTFGPPEIAILLDFLPKERHERITRDWLEEYIDAYRLWLTVWGEGEGAKGCDGGLAEIRLGGLWAYMQALEEKGGYGGKRSGQPGCYISQGDTNGDRIVARDTSVDDCEYVTLGPHLRPAGRIFAFIVQRLQEVRRQQLTSPALSIPFAVKSKHETQEETGARIGRAWYTLKHLCASLALGCPLRLSEAFLLPPPRTIDTEEMPWAVNDDPLLLEETRSGAEGVGKRILADFQDFNSQREAVSILLD